MATSLKIKKVIARELLDSRGFPTVEAELHTEINGKDLCTRALVPSGASTGEGEALELRDGDATRFKGKGVLKAVGHVQGPISQALTGKTFSSLNEFDRQLLSLDGTDNKSKLGANAILGVSMAFARAQAQSAGRELYAQLAEEFPSNGTTLPVPLMNILNGGKHADNGLDIQEFMIVPAGFKTFRESLQAGAEVFHHLKAILHDRGLATSVGDEGGFAPVIEGEHKHEQVIELILRSIEKAGYRPGEQIYLALDCAASEFCKMSGEQGTYKFEGQPLSSAEMISHYEKWVSKYPVVSIEDGLGEADWKGWSALTQKLGPRCQLVGDDLFVTNISYLKKGIEGKVANSILIKLNQIGSVSETLETMRLARQNHYTAISSHRSGETEDTFIADLAVGSDCGQIKTGSASRTDRMAKYNQLLRIEEWLGNKARFPGLSAFNMKK